MLSPGLLIIKILPSSSTTLRPLQDATARCQEDVSLYHAYPSCSRGLGRSLSSRVTWLGSLRIARRRNNISCLILLQVNVTWFENADLPHYTSTECFLLYTSKEIFLLLPTAFIYLSTLLNSCHPENTEVAFTYFGLAYSQLFQHCPLPSLFSAHLQS